MRSNGGSCRDGSSNRRSRDGGSMQRPASPGRRPSPRRITAGRLRTAFWASSACLPGALARYRQSLGPRAGRRATGRASRRMRARAASGRAAGRMPRRGRPGVPAAAPLRRRARPRERAVHRARRTGRGGSRLSCRAGRGCDRLGDIVADLVDDLAGLARAEPGHAFELPRYSVARAVEMGGRAETVSGQVAATRQMPRRRCGWPRAGAP